MDVPDWVGRGVTPAAAIIIAVVVEQTDACYASAVLVLAPPELYSKNLFM